MATGSARSIISSAAIQLVEAWNGSRWAMVPNRIDPNSNNVLHRDSDGVSCSSGSSCILVHAEHIWGWNGQALTQQHTPTVFKTDGVYLFGVSCLATGVCTAVGYGFGSSKLLTVAARN
jgi:hypothetical protein